MRWAYLVVLLLATATLLGSGLGYAREFLAVDSCLDSSGSFDYSTMTCDHVQNHAYVPYRRRHPATVPLAVVAAIVAVSAIAGLRRNTPSIRDLRLLT
jgi:hypothetical protein